MRTVARCDHPGVRTGIGDRTIDDEPCVLSGRFELPGIRDVADDYQALRGGAFHPPGIPDAVYSGIDRQCRGRAVAVDRCPIDERKRWATDDAGAAYRVVDIDERGRRQEEGIQGSGGNDAAMPVRAQCDRAVTAQGDVGPDNEFGAVAGRIECDLAAVPESDVAPKYCVDLQRGAIADTRRPDKLRIKRCGCCWNEFFRRNLFQPLLVSLVLADEPIAHDPASSV